MAKSRKSTTRLKHFPDQAEASELDAFLKEYPDVQMVEVLIPDINGIPRGKRIIPAEMRTLYSEGVKACGGTPLMSCKGETIPELGLGTVDGDPDLIVHPVAGTLAPVPWLKSRTAQVVVGTVKPNGDLSIYDSRNILRHAMQPLVEMGLKAVIATEMEFYLLADRDAPEPAPALGSVPGTNLRQDGLQYAMMEDLWEADEFLAEIHETCRLQHVPSTTVHSEFAPSQMEINVHHVDDAVKACDHALLLKRAIKGVARRYGWGATFMAKPFAEFAGCGLHIHVSLYDAEGRNVFAVPGADSDPPASDMLRFAVGGLGRTMADAMALFAPNANSYRRLQPNSFVPLKPNWGFNHRSVAMRIPLSDPDNLRIEHRVAGADANPYLVTAAVLAGIHYGLTEKCDPGKPVPEGTFLHDEEITLPTRWERALEIFDGSEVMKRYLGKEFCRIFSVCRHSENDQFHAEISNRDYEWYLRAV